MKLFLFVCFFSVLVFGSKFLLFGEKDVSDEEKKDLVEDNTPSSENQEVEKDQINNSESENKEAVSNKISDESKISVNSSLSAEEKEKIMMRGKEAFIFCMACHGQDGKGLSVGDKKMANTLFKSKYVNGPADVLALIILKGIKKENDKFLNTMNSLEAVFDDEKLADVMSYVRNSFENSSSYVSVEEAKSYREKWESIKEPVSYDKINELIEKSKN